MDARTWIQSLQLAPHPEGGYYRETYHAPRWIGDEDTVAKYGDRRRSATSIYFLLETNDVSHFHRLKSDEMWYYHAGDPLDIHIIAPDGQYERLSLGIRLDDGQMPQRLVPAGCIFGSSASVGSSARFGYSLVSCMVSPGFDFRDFELFQLESLLSQFPQHEDVIRRLAIP